MNQDIILTIDNGTQSVRALLFDLQGNLLDKSQIQLEPYFSHQPGWAEQEPAYFWEKAGGSVPSAVVADGSAPRGHRRGHGHHPARHHRQP